MTHTMALSSHWSQRETTTMLTNQQKIKIENTLHEISADAEQLSTRTQDLSREEMFYEVTKLLDKVETLRMSFLRRGP